MFPDKPLIITEYGADNDPRIRSFDSERFDFSADYAVRYHQAYLKTIMDRPFIAGANVWNLADFYSEARKDAMPHINCKGLVSNDRVPKDSYWYYMAVLGRTPQLIISGRDWLVRGEMKAVIRLSTCTQTSLRWNCSSTVSRQESVRPRTALLLSLSGLWTEKTF